jgi:hypothetical protein
MERKDSLITSTYKQLSRGNEAWKKTYITEKPWREMAVDIDSLIFFYMRNYLDIPYTTHKDERMVADTFIRNTKKATQWVVDDMVRYCTKQLVLLLKYLKSIDIKLHPVFSDGYPKLKRELRAERTRERDKMERKFSQMDRDEVLSSIKKYILHFRDEVRDIVVEHKRLKEHLSCCTEADKWCGKNYRVTMTEDVDIFLFGTKKTIIVKPFLMDEIPKYFWFVDCKSYFVDMGIATHDDFLQVAFMMGTDYNYGIKGMGKKRSVEAINKYGSVAKFVAVKYDITDEGVEKLMKEYKRFITYVTF